VKEWAERFWAKVDKRGPDECWPWAAALSNRGYGKFSIPKNRWLLAHRVAWQLTHGLIPEGQIVRHKCDNPLCTNPEHLELGTHQDNSDDMAKRQRHGANVRLKPAVARAIREAAKTETGPAVARAFGVHPATVYRIASGKYWRHA
jgi:hypothetical protein